MLCVFPWHQGTTQNRILLRTCPELLLWRNTWHLGLWFGEIPYCLPAPQFLLHFRFHSTAYSKILSCQALEMWSVEHFTLSHAHSPETIVIRQLAWDQTWSNYIKLAYASNSRQWAESCAQNLYDIQVRYSFNCQVEPQIKPCLFARQPVKVLYMSGQGSPFTSPFQGMCHPSAGGHAAPLSQRLQTCFISAIPCYGKGLHDTASGYLLARLKKGSSTQETSHAKVGPPWKQTSNTASEWS